MINAIFGVIDFLIDLLPDSPFLKFQHTISAIEWLQFMNWVIPISNWIAILEVYLIAVVALMIWRNFSGYHGFIYRVGSTMFNSIYKLIKKWL